MGWEYAELSKEAKDAGGPEKFVELLIESGKEEGHKEMLPIVGLAIGVGTLGGILISKVFGLFRKKHVKPEEVETAKRELIQGVKDYDFSQGEQVDVDQDDTDTFCQEQGM